MKLSKSIFTSDTAKYIYIGAGVIFLIILIVWIIRKFRKIDDEETIKTIEKTIDANSLTYEDAQYATFADELAGYLGDKFTDSTAGVLLGPWATSAGFYGVNQKGIYSVMEKMKTVDDVKKLISAFGIKTIRKMWDWNSTTGNLNTFMSQFLTTGEKQKVNEILADNGVNYNF